jgi:glycosyltransferase involved in cell wall biosynthesis
MAAITKSEIEISDFLRDDQTPKKWLNSSVVAVIPAYNEARFIGSVVLLTREYVDEVIVVDDGSTDDTAIIARKAGAIVVQHPVNRGKGEALNTGFKKAHELLLPTAVVTLDGDWQHLPEELPDVVKPIIEGQADVVIGSRYLKHTSKVPFQRILGHAGFTRMINLLSGTRVTDSQSGFRAFSLDAVQQIKFTSRGFSVESEMQFVASDRALRVVEVPITIRYLDHPKRSLFQHGFKVLTGILRLIGQHRPLLFFSLTSIVSLTLAVIMILLEVDQYSNHQTFDVIIGVLALIFLINGSIALFTGIILHTIRGFVLDMIRPVLHRDR